MSARIPHGCCQPCYRRLAPSGAGAATGAVATPVILSYAGSHSDEGSHEKEPDAYQNLACRPAAAAQGVGGHAGAARQCRADRPRRHRRRGDAGDCRDGEEAGRGRDRLHRRRRVLDGPQPRALHRAFYRHRGAPGGFGEPPTTRHSTRERDEFPDFYADCDRAGTLFLVPGEKPMPPVTVRVVARGPVRSKDPEAINRQLDTFKAAIQRSGAAVEEAFVPVLAPGWLDHFIFNEYYQTEDEFLFALAEALREEYRAVVAAGFILQIDDPGLPDWWDMLKPEPTVEAYRQFARLRIDAVNHANW